MLPLIAIDLQTFTPDQRRDLANAMLRAAWSAALPETRIALLDVAVSIDESIWGDERV